MRPVALWLASVLGLAAACAWAQPGSASLTRAAELRQDKRPGAPSLRTLPAGEPVEVLALEGGWALVAPRSGERKPGWLRAGVLDLAAAASAASALPTSRAAATAATVTLGVRGDGEPRWHAVLLVADMPGHAARERRAGAADVESALQIAAALGVASEDLRLLQDGAAGAQPWAAAVREAASRMGRGDGLLLYVSAPGGRVGDGAACAEALVPRAGEALTGVDMGALLAPLAQRRHPLLAIYDASFAPAAPRALAARGLRTPADEGLLRLRSDPKPGACGPGAAGFAQAAGVPLAARDQAQLAFAGEGALAFEDEFKGGLLTQYLRDCLLRDARAGGAAPSLGEVQACTGGKIAARLQGARGVAAAAPALAGDASLPLGPLAGRSQLR